MAERNESPVQMPGIAQSLKFIAMKTITNVREEMNQCDGRCEFPRAPPLC